MPSCSYLTLDLDALSHNLSRLTSTFGHVMVMVKANAYGTDSAMVSKFIQSNFWPRISYLGVSHVWEGIHLRESGIHLPIFVISTPPYEAEEAVRYHLSPAVSTLDEVDALAAASHRQGRTTPVHLHLNTGMNRFGISSAEGRFLYDRIHSLPSLHLEGIMTHFIAAESSSFDSISQDQVFQFKQFIDSLPSLPRWIHAANSGGAVRFLLPFCNLVRIGLGIFGYGVCLQDSKPTLKLSTKLASIQHCKKGATIGYHCTYTLQKDEGKIGVIPFGYYDGFHRKLSNKGYVLVRGKKAAMIGMVCMDFMMIDLSDIPEAQVGDEVVLFGPDLSPETVASWGQTDVREILTSISKRVYRHFIPIPPRRIYEPTHTERLSAPLFALEKDSAPR